MSSQYLLPLNMYSISTELWYVTLEMGAATHWLRHRDNKHKHCGIGLVPPTPRGVLRRHNVLHRPTMACRDNCSVNTLLPWIVTKMRSFSFVNNAGADFCWMLRRHQLWGAPCVAVMGHGDDCGLWPPRSVGVCDTLAWWHNIVASYLQVDIMVLVMIGTYLRGTIL